MGGKAVRSAGGLPGEQLQVLSVCKQRRDKRQCLSVYLSGHAVLCMEVRVPVRVSPDNESLPRPHGRDWGSWSADGRVRGEGSQLSNTDTHARTHTDARPDLVGDHLDGKVWVGPRRQSSETHHCGASSMVGIPMAGGTVLTP